MPGTVRDTTELDFGRLLRDELVAVIKERGLSTEEVADLTGLFPSGVEALMRREAWPLQSALRVANGLRLDLRPNFHELPTSS
jgi:transcriptional regulator with XRE-family HTH domain